MEFKFVQWKTIPLFQEEIIATLNQSELFLSLYYIVNFKSVYYLFYWLCCREVWLCGSAVEAWRGSAWIHRHRGWERWEVRDREENGLSTSWFWSSLLMLAWLVFLQHVFPLFFKIDFVYSHLVYFGSPVFFNSPEFT